MFGLELRRNARFLKVNLGTKLTTRTMGIGFFIPDTVCTKKDGRNLARRSRNACPHNAPETGMIR
jgi:hypothetical protein